MEWESRSQNIHVRGHWYPILFGYGTQNGDILFTDNFSEIMSEYENSYFIFINTQTSEM